MSSDSNLTEEEMKIVLEVQQILQRITKTINRFPQNLKDQLTSDIENFTEEAQSFNNLLNS